MTSKQLSLFNQPSLNVLRDLKEAMADAYKATGLSKDELCDKLNSLAERYGVRMMKGRSSNLTVATLEKWLNPEDKERVIPIKALPVFCAVVEDIGPMQVLVAPLGWQVIDDRQAKLLQLAELEREVEVKKARMRKLKKEL